MKPGTPRVNINGSTAQELIDARIGAMDTVRQAMRALSECAPNGRDYQTAPAGEYETARKLYAERFAFLDKLLYELQDEAIAIQDQGKRHET